MPPRAEKTLESATAYTIGWITALVHERAAALVMLDERHNKPKGFVQAGGDSNSYTWGEIGEHNVVIASLPDGEYGLVAAAGTVHGLLASLPHIRVGLFVGIGAGVSKDVLLGDVVVSRPEGTHGGVVQYDLFKATTSEGAPQYERKGFLDRPPSVLLNALSAVRAEHEMGDSEVPQLLEAFQKHEKMRVAYAFPGVDKDVLRSPGDRTLPEIHYGTIASGNMLIKNAAERDGLIAWLRDQNINPLCFEMEAAGVMNSFPCLVIRGICDYADERKDDVWQKYAAGAAAAFAKELLGYVDTQDIQESKAIGQVVEEIKELRQDVRQGFVDTQTTMNDNREREQLQTRLDIAKDAAYNAGSGEHATKCLPGTRVDLLAQISAWTEDEDGKCIYWLCGKAGMGKSTVARTVAQMLDERKQLVASFFFKRGESGRNNASRFFPTIAMHMTERILTTRKSVVEALDADSLICAKNIEDQFKRLVLTPIAALQGDSPSQGVLAIVIDALDECDNQWEVRKIITLLSRLNSIALHFRIFITSRPELPVELGFSELDRSIHHDIKLEVVQAGSIDKDIRTYLEHEIAEVRKKMALPRYGEGLANDWPGEEQVTTLVDLAVPLFIFAFTMCRYLLERNTEQRLKALLERDSAYAFSELGKTYIPILQQIVREQPPAERDRAVLNFRRIVGTIILLKDPLSAESLSTLLEMPLDEIQDTLDHLHSVLDIPGMTDEPIRLLHLSFRDFLVSAEDKAAEVFRIDEDKMHAEIAEQCLRLLEKTLKRDICGLEKPGVLVEEVDQQKISSCIPPAVAYASTYWPGHVLASEQDMCGRLYGWLVRRFLYWVECAAWLGSRIDIEDDISRLDGRVRAHESSELSAMLHDAVRFLQMYRDVIDEAPLQLYDSAMIFTPIESIIRQSLAHEAQTIFSRLPKVQSKWDEERSEGHDDSVNAVTFSPDGKLVASGSADKTVRVWNATSCEEILKLQGHEDEVTAVVFSPYDKVIASASADETVRLWDAVSGEEILKLQGHDDKVFAVAFSPDGRLVASGSADKTVRVWNATSGEEILRLQGHEDEVSVVVFSRDGKVIASGSADETIRVWDTTSCEEILRLQGHEDEVYAVALSSDGKLIASGSADKTVRVWNAASGEQVKQIDTGDWVWEVVFSPDGKTLRTNVGVFDLQECVAAQKPDAKPKSFLLLSLERRSIMYNDKDILSLPREYWFLCSARYGSMLAVGELSGGVSFYSVKETFLELDQDILPIR